MSLSVRWQQSENLKDLIMNNNEKFLFDDENVTAPDRISGTNFS